MKHGWWRFWLKILLKINLMRYVLHASFSYSQTLYGLITRTDYKESSLHSTAITHQSPTVEPFLTDCLSRFFNTLHCPVDSSHSCGGISLGMQLNCYSATPPNNKHTHSRQKIRSSPKDTRSRLYCTQDKAPGQVPARRRYGSRSRPSRADIQDLLSSSNACKWKNADL